MSTKDRIGLRKVIIDFASANDWEVREFITFQCLLLIETMSKYGYSEEAFSGTCRQMKKDFKKVLTHKDF